jgi:ubiquitin C-terminal hydrolase
VTFPLTLGFNNKRYQLIAVLCHHGTLEGGHWSTFARRAGVWYHFSDADVTPASDDDVLKAQASTLLYSKDLDGLLVSWCCFAWLVVF